MNANSEITLTETSKPGISATAPRNEIGIPRLDPEDEPQLEEQRQHDEDEREPGGAVAQQQCQAVVEHLGFVEPDRHRDALGQPRPRAFDVVLDRGRDVQRTLIAGAEDRHEHRRLLVEASLLVGLGEAVDHRRHVAEPQPAAVRAGPQHEVLELVASVGLPIVRRRISPPSVRTEPRAGRATNGARRRRPDRR